MKTALVKMVAIVLQRLTEASVPVQKLIQGAFVNMMRLFQIAT